MRSCLAVIEIEEKRKEFEKREMDLKEKEEKLSKKSHRNYECHRRSQAGGRPAAANGGTARPLC